VSREHGEQAVSKDRSPKPPAATQLTVIVRDYSPVVFMEDPVRHRSVRIALTPEQVEQLALRWTGTQGGSSLYEEISHCFLEVPGTARTETGP
jgi:hypothetical protein